MEAAHDLSDPAIARAVADAINVVTADILRNTPKVYPKGHPVDDLPSVPLEMERSLKRGRIEDARNRAALAEKYLEVFSPTEDGSVAAKSVLARRLQASPARVIRCARSCSASRAPRCAVAGEVAGRIGAGLMVLAGVGTGDGEEDAVALARKIAGLRIFRDASGDMNLDVREAGGEVLVVSQFTLHGDARKGRRPSFIAAARPEQAEPLYESFIAALRREGLKTASGRFGATMEVELLNEGPVTILLDSKRLF